ncbi:MAG: hypothetical protein GY909_15200 [Oligoflexia bacterium]|nr:hypothetical protein [Oligoflexia bacterium]
MNFIKNVILWMIKYVGGFFDKIVKFLLSPFKREDGKYGMPKNILKAIFLSVFLLFGSLYIYDKYVSDDVLEFKNSWDKSVEIGYGNSEYIDDVAGRESSGFYENDEENLNKSFDDYMSSVSEDSVPSFDVCKNLIARASKGEKLEGDLKRKLDLCLEHNVTGLSDLQRKALDTLINDPDSLTEAEKKLLQDFVDGKINDDDVVAQIDALLGDDPIKRKIAKQLINNPNLTEEERKRLQDLLKKKDLTPEDIAFVEDMVKKYGDFEPKSDDEELNQNESDLSKARSLAKEIQKIDEEIKDLEDELERDKEEYNRILDKERKGLPLSDKERAFLKNYLAKKDRLSELKKKREKLLKKYAQIQQKIAKDLATSNMLVKSSLGPGEYVELGNVIECSGIPKITKRKKRFKKVKRPVKKLRKLTPDEIEFLGLGATDPNRRIARVNTEQIQLKADSFYFHQEKKEQLLKLPPNIKINAVAMERILLSDGQSGKRVSFRILEDIKDVLTNDIIFHKNSIASGLTQPFDSATQTVLVSIDSITTGPITKNVGLTIEVPGKVKHTRGEQIQEVFITELMSSAAQYFRDQAENETTDTTLLADAITKSTTEAGAGALEKVGQFLANDLRNVKSVFYTPSDIRLVIISR